MVGWRTVPFWCFVNIHPCSLLCKIFPKAETWLGAQGKPESGRELWEDSACRWAELAWRLSHGPWHRTPCDFRFPPSPMSQDEIAHQNQRNCVQEALGQGNLYSACPRHSVTRTLQVPTTPHRFPCLIAGTLLGGHLQDCGKLEEIPLRGQLPYLNQQAEANSC